MPTRAKVYITSAIVTGAALLAGCLVFAWDFPDVWKYMGYLALACIGSTLKIKLPKIRTTMSISFVFILMGISELTLSETMALGGIAALVQCLWRPRKQPTLLHVLFNISTLVTSVAIAYALSHALAPGSNVAVLLAVAVCLYFVSNTGMVSLVLSLTEERPLAKVWRQCYLWSFPYYLAGGAIATAIAFSSRAVGWKSSLLILPLMYLIYSYYRMYTEHEHPEVA